MNLTNSVKGTLEAFRPKALRRKWRSFFAQRSVPEREFRGLSRTEIFAKIYQEGIWGRNSNDDTGFYSGPGSHYPRLIGPYLEAILGALAQHDQPLTVVDLGCGDFNIGKQIAPHVARYIACDLVPDVIAANVAQNQLENVEFRVLDIVTDPLPSGDVIILRQVLQHLSNAEIKIVSDRLSRHCRYLLLTEHLAYPKTFIANIDKPAGRDARLAFGSGVDLGTAPFNMAFRSRRVLCEVEDFGGIIQTVEYAY